VHQIYFGLMDKFLVLQLKFHFSTENIARLKQ